MAKEYIEREALIKSENWQSLKSDFDKARAHIIILGQLAADVVEVVRCGQCKHATDDIIVEGVCYCHKIQQGMFLDGFCSYGERRSGNERHFMVDSYKY